jgi:nucleoid-associated protein YgaU
MAIDRYQNTPIIAYGSQYGTAEATNIIRKAIIGGNLAYKEVVVRGRERLDTLSGQLYGDSGYWWVLAAASEIGWALQIPPGTVLKVPDLKQVLNLV